MEGSARGWQGTEHYLNAEFDLSLRRRWRGLGHGEAARQVGELSLQAVIGAGSGDSVLVRQPVPAEFLEYLDRNGLGVPAVSVLPAVRPQARFEPFGWCADTVAVCGRYDRPPGHPSLDVVRMVNGRRFAADLEAVLDGRPFGLGGFGSVADLEAFLERQQPTVEGWVVKADHGNAGLGNRRLRSRRLGAADRGFVSRILEEDDWVILEPWCDRSIDLCTTFRLRADGEIANLHIHEVVNTADGAFIGALFEPSRKAADWWSQPLGDAARRVARGLAEEGYFGPVCLDAFAWNEGGRRRLRSLADLNARSHVSAGALRLWREWGASMALCWRFFSTRKLELPPTLGDLAAALGHDAFDPSRRRGVLAASPPWLAGSRRHRRPTKVAFLIAGDSREEVFAMERRFRELFER